jgi:hypothetical protein
MLLTALEFIVCPACKADLDFNGKDNLLCRSCKARYEVREGIPILLANQREGELPNSSHYERIHAAQADPWNYRVRAAEILKRQCIVDQISASCASPSRVLDLGCSSGYMSMELGNICPSVFSVDIALSAVAQARATCTSAISNRHAGHSFYVSRADALPFRSEFFDVVVASDGLDEWNLPPDVERTVLHECHRVLVSGGIAIFTDYLRSERFDDWIAKVKQGPLKVIAVQYLHDRLWYQFESAFHMVSGWGLVKAILRNITLAQLLVRAGRLVGKKGSKHILIVAQK